MEASLPSPGGWSGRRMWTCTIPAALPACRRSLVPAILIRMCPGAGSWHRQINSVPWAPKYNCSDMRVVLIPYCRKRSKPRGSFSFVLSKLGQVRCGILSFMAKLALPLLVFLLALPAESQPGALPDVAPVQAQHAMVVSIHHLASDAGLKMLQAGGNAVDAAVATGFALAVVYPDAGNLGGGGFMMLRLANGESHFLDFREEAPLRATANMYLDSNGKIIPEASTVGYTSVGVPVSVDGLVEAERRFGKFSLAPGLAPPLQFKEKGDVLSAEEAATLHDPLLTRFPESRRIFQRDGNF